MKFEDLKNAGALVPTDGERKTVTWKNPHTKEEFTFDIFVKRRSYGSVERIYIDDSGKAKGALTISECVLIGEAAEPISYEDAFNLEPSLASVFMKAIGEVNGDGKKRTGK